MFCLVCNVHLFMICTVFCGRRCRSADLFSLYLDAVVAARAVDLLSFCFCRIGELEAKGRSRYSTRCGVAVGVVVNDVCFTFETYFVLSAGGFWYPS